MAHGKGDTKGRKYFEPGGNKTKKETYAQNPYGGMYASKTKNREEYEENMPKQGFKSETELDEEEDKVRKGKTLLTSGRSN